MEARFETVEDTMSVLRVPETDNTRQHTLTTKPPGKDLRLSVHGAVSDMLIKR